jgi:two-component system response regulator FixJ
VLLDYHMAGANGIAVLNAMHDLSDRFVVVMLTAHGGVRRSVEAMHCGAFDFLEKPYDSIDLLACIEDAVAKLDAKRAAIAKRDAAREQLATLSPREADVLDGLLTGYSNKQIAWKLAISPRTAEIYRANMMQKLKVGSLAHALRIIFCADPERVSRQAFATARRDGAGRCTH